MIARRPHPQEPDNPNRCVFAPLTNDPDRGEWIPLLGAEGYRFDEVDAARVCMAAFLRAWRTIEQLARRLRVYTEHPAFAAFSAESIDARMIADSARELATAVQLADVNVTRLLDEPGQDDLIRIGDRLYKVDEHSSQLVAVDDFAIPERTPSPAQLFLRMIIAALDHVRTTTHQSVDRQGFEEAIDMLILMLPEEDAQDDREPGQFIADHRFARHIATAARKARERTGRPVSIHGLRDALAVLQRIVEDRAKRSPGADADRSTHEDDRATDTATTSGGSKDGESTLENRTRKTPNDAENFENGES